MATTTSTRPVDTTSPTPVGRPVSLADRVALRIGLALVLWSRRTHHRARTDAERSGLARSGPGRLELARRTSAARAEEERLAAWQRNAALLGRWR